MEQFSENLRHLMQKKGITQEQLAAASGVPRPNISRILSGSERVTIDRAERLAKAAGTTLLKLLSRNSKIPA